MTFTILDQYIKELEVLKRRTIDKLVSQQSLQWPLSDVETKKLHTIFITLYGVDDSPEMFFVYNDHPPGISFLVRNNLSNQEKESINLLLLKIFGRKFIMNGLPLGCDGMAKYFWRLV